MSTTTPFSLAGHTALITGGATGIGFSMAERLLRAGSTVIVCGRRAARLDAARAVHPRLQVRACDLASAAEREALARWAIEAFPTLNLLVNNAGIQNRFHLLRDRTSWPERQQEIAINLEAPIHLCQLLLQHLVRQRQPAIVNITSGLAFAPGPFAPIYSATKAALHSFTLSLRAQVAEAGVRVIEIAPPAVNTDLGGPGLHTQGVPLDEFTDSVLDRVTRGELEVGYGTSETRRLASRAELDATFEKMKQIPV